MTREGAKWPWLLDNTDTVTRDPRTGATDEYHVTGTPTRDYDTTVVTCELPDGGESVLVYHGAEKATIRLRELYTEQQRDDALGVLTCGDRAYITGFVRQNYREVFDQALKQITRRVIAEYDAKKETTP